MSPIPVRWAVLGSANIAAKAFLPALRAAGGRAVVVGTRNPNGAVEWAQNNQVDAVASYQDAIQHEEVQAIYIALPNHEHIAWAKAAVATGRAVVCEKPLGLDSSQVADLLKMCSGQTPIWESFAFQFHPQTHLLRDLVARGEIGDVREVISEFHFNVTAPSNIRMSAELGGGALYDVGCYPVRLARLVFDAETEGVSARSFAGNSGVDIDMAAICDFSAERRLILSAGMHRPPSTFTRVIGSAGEIRLSNPYHPNSNDSLELWRRGRHQQSWAAGSATAFQYMIDHVQQVVSAGATPELTAVASSLGNASALDAIRAAMVAG